MKIKLIYSLCLLLSVAQLKAQTPNWQWAKSFGGSHNDAGLDVVADASGNVYTIGVFHDTVDFDPGTGIANLMTNVSYPQSVFLNKLDAQGNFIWAKQWDKMYSYSGYSLNTDVAGNIYITGNYFGAIDFDPGPALYADTSNFYISYFVLKLNSAGNFMWAKTFGGAYNTPRCHTAIDPSGNFYIAGMFSDSHDFDPGPLYYGLTATSGRDAFILKLDASGNFVWVKQISGTINNWLNDITLDNQNNICITGTFSGTTDFDPGTGTALLTAGTTIGNEDVFIAKYNSSGSYLWAKSIGGPNLDYSNGIATDNAGNVYTTGTYTATNGGNVDFDPGPGIYNLTGTSHGFISKLDNAGNFVFAKSIGGYLNFTFSYGISLDADANIYYTGYYTDSTDFDPGPATYMLYADTSLGAPVFLSALDSAGNFLWAETKGGKFHLGIQQNSGISVFCDALNNVYFTGRYEDPSMTFGNSTLFNYTPDTLLYTDVFLAKIAGETSGIKNEAVVSAAVNVYPNPSAGIFTLHCRQTLTDVEIYNTLGEKVFSKANFNEPHLCINLNGHANGVYYYLLKTSNGTIFTGKILKE